MANLDSSDKSLFYLPLGGAGEIGMNLNLYGHAGKWLMVDLGVSFGDDSMPAVDVFMADPAFIEERKKDLVGLVITHAHEDHLGAVPHLWERFRCPVYATPFTAGFLHEKLKETGIEKKVEVNVIDLSGRFQAGPFDIQLVSVTHSIPEPNSLIIRTKAGTVLHTGDWKFDPDPLTGPTADEAALAKVGEEGVLAMIGDSTNVFSAGTAGSEADVRESLTQLIGTYKSGRVAVGCFASNIARLETIALAAEANGRSVCLVGRSLHRMYKVAKATGYLKDMPALLDEEEIGYLPRERVLLICTGSQGEPRAALTRIAGDTHPGVSLQSGDTVIFSARQIPGNEKAIGRLQNRLAMKGIDIVTARDEFIHVSGHPARDDLEKMYGFIKPRIAIPVHGEYRHQAEHARLAKRCGVEETLVIANGDLVRLAPGVAEVVDEVFAGRLAVAGNKLVPLGGTMLRDRQRLLHNGCIAVTLVMDADGALLSDPSVASFGLLDIDVEDDAALEDELIDDIADFVEDLPRGKRRDDNAVEEAVRHMVRRWVKIEVGLKPLTDIQVARV
ncbi:MAG: ribonuclease J [Alphaproteobacteria bacterium]|nr:ribonuclease J [Alphaproteobacteria bacterium]